MRDHHPQESDARIRAALETLLNHSAEESRRAIAALRAVVDQGLASVESTLSTAAHDKAIDAAVESIARASGDRLDIERQQSDAALGQALSANARLRTALTEAQQQTEAVQQQAASADADHKAAVARHEFVSSEKHQLGLELDKARAQIVDLRVQLKRQQQITEELAAERAELHRWLGEVTTARELAQAQHAQLERVSQKLTNALSKTSPPVRDDSRPIGDAAPDAPASPRQEPPARAEAAVPAPATKVLQFSEKARDAQRIAMRQGTHITVDNIPGELVDLSVGGAQVVLRQSVKPNQLVRLQLQPGRTDLAARARVVWVIYEQRATSLSVYRTGLKLTEVDVPAIERFMADFCAAPAAQSQGA